MNSPCECKTERLISPAESKTMSWVIGTVDHPTGQVLKIKTEWSRKDHIGQIRARTSSYRMKYRVPPGLYAVGAPDESSPVLITANYKLSFDKLRRELNGIHAWILVLDTQGINVWCAAGKGTFGTVELVNKMKAVGLDKIVKHRRIILPQLGAPGIHSHVVKKATGFTVSFGPVYAKDTPAYLQAGFKATKEMRTVRFGLVDRLILTPMELNPAFSKLWILILSIFILFGLQPEGLIFKQAWALGMPFLIMSSASYTAPAAVYSLSFFCHQRVASGSDLVYRLVSSYIPPARPQSFFIDRLLLIFPCRKFFPGLQLHRIDQFHPLIWRKERTADFYPDIHHCCHHLCDIHYLR